MNPDDKTLELTGTRFAALRKYADGAAWSHFYSEEDIAWEPFEHYSQEWLDDQCDDLADMIFNAMLWAINTHKESEKS